MTLIDQFKNLECKFGILDQRKNGNYPQGVKYNPIFLMQGSFRITLLSMWDCLGHLVMYNLFQITYISQQPLNCSYENCQYITQNVNGVNPYSNIHYSMSDTKYFNFVLWEFTNITDIDGNMTIISLNDIQVHYIFC